MENSVIKSYIINSVTEALESGKKSCEIEIEALEGIPGWYQKEDITKIKSFTDLPQNFKNYINFLEDNLNVKIKIVSVGPDRTQTIFV